MPMLALQDDSPGGWASDLFEAIASLAVVAIAACGLVGIYAPILAAVATIVLGATFAAQGTSILRSYEQDRALHARSMRPLRYSMVVAGLFGMVLGVIALFDVNPALLTPIASILFGAGLVLKSSVAWELRLLRIDVISGVLAKSAVVSLLIRNDAPIIALSGFVSGALGASAAAGAPNDLTLNLIALVVAASALALGSKAAMRLALRFSAPIPLPQNRTTARALSSNLSGGTEAT